MEDETRDRSVYMWIGINVNGYTLTGNDNGFSLYTITLQLLAAADIIHASTSFKSL